MSDWSKLSPPEISAKQCQKLVDKYFQEDEPLSGRPVMIPFTKQAFVMGELQPVIEKNSGTDGGAELVQVRPGKDEALQTLSTADAKQWLLQKSQPTPTEPPATSPVAKPKASSTSDVNKPEAQLPNHTTASSTGSKKTASQAKNQKPAPSIPFHPTMVEIHEEFNEDGTQTKGDIVNVTSEFQALMDKLGQGDSMKFPQDYGGGANGETKEEPPEIGSEGDDMIDDDAPLKQLTDPEYDQLARRLDELARLEEMEEERLEQGAKFGKLKAKRAAANKNKSSGGSGGWNKGFLNQPKKKKHATKQASTAKDSPATIANESKPQQLSPPPSDQVTSNASSSQEEKSDAEFPPSAPAVQNTTGGVAFDLSQNKVQEIPSLPGTRPIPPRKNNPSINPAASSDAPRMMDSSVFSGVIQERQTAVGEGNAKADNTNTIRERSAPQSFRRRRPQQQQQTQPSQVSDPNKPKKLSRFAQERMG